MRQCILLSPIIFNIFLEYTINQSLENYNGTININGRQFAVLRFTNDMGGLSVSEDELSNMTK